MWSLARDYGAQARMASGLNVVLGIWLIASPWVFDYGGRPAILSRMFLGTLIAFLAAIRVASLNNSVGLSGINLLLAFWTVVSPWAYQYETMEALLLNDIIVGMLVAALAIWSAIATDAEQRRKRDTPAH